MNSKSLVLTALLLGSSPVLAQYQLPPVQVRAAPVYPDSQAALSFACGNLSEPSTADVESLLKIAEHSQTGRLRSQLMDAVVDACNAGIPFIVVQRSRQGRSLSWRAANRYETGVALY